MDLPFAIDDLYSAGWWPTDADPCIQAPDGRWYPDPAAITAAFDRAGAGLRLSPPSPGHACRADWSTPRGVHGSIIAENETSAGLLALAALIRAKPAITPRPG